MGEGTSQDRKPFAFLQTEFNETHGQLSPDSQWMAYTSDESGQREVYVRAFPSGDGKWKISTTGGEQPRWRGDGQGVVLCRGRRKDHCGWRESHAQALIGCWNSRAAIRFAYERIGDER
jgi:hypothetical protein